MRVLSVEPQLVFEAGYFDCSRDTASEDRIELFERLFRANRRARILTPDASVTNFEGNRASTPGQHLRTEWPADRQIQWARIHHASPCRTQLIGHAFERV